MNRHTPVMFDGALDIAIKKIKSIGTGLGKEIVLVRDLRGRIRVLLPGRRKDYSGSRKAILDKLGQDMSETLGAYGFPPDRAVLFSDDLAQGEEIMTGSDRRLIDKEGELNIYLLDRQIIGHDWMRIPLVRRTRTHRVTFFSIKGGVGRSTAAAIWAWRLAKQGKSVLVVDLDLESPGVSSTLLPSEYLPDYGIVDWFVEDGVGQAEIVEKMMTATSPLARDLPGKIQVLPAFGQATGDYLPKLARCFSEFSGNESRPWAERLQQMIEQVERKEEPDLVILDSRAGLHDIAAALVTRMEADTFLFAVDSMQTWVAYQFLFKHWCEHPAVADFRQHLQMVAGMVPETGRKEHLKRFEENSWDLFREHLYDEVQADTPDAFSFDLSDPEAPHYPLPVFWHRALQEFDPIKSETGLDKKTAEEALGIFMDAAEKIVFSGEGTK